MKEDLKRTLEDLRAKCLARIDQVQVRVNRLLAADQTVNLYFTKRAIRKLREYTQNQLAKH